LASLQIRTDGYAEGPTHNAWNHAFAAILKPAWREVSCFAQSAPRETAISESTNIRTGVAAAPKR
jgi:hypothetical protein